VYCREEGKKEKGRIFGEGSVENAPTRIIQNKKNATFQQKPKGFPQTTDGGTHFSQQLGGTIGEESSGKKLQPVNPGPFTKK